MSRAAHLGHVNPLDIISLQFERYLSEHEFGQKQMKVGDWSMAVTRQMYDTCVYITSGLRLVTAKISNVPLEPQERDGGHTTRR